MIQLLYESTQRIAKRNKIDDIAVLVELPLDFRTNTVVVSVDTLADVSSKRDEMR